MAKNVRLKNSDGVVIYPQTKSENIIDKDNLISAVVAGLENIQKTDGTPVVEANPTETTDTLSSIGIDGTNYAMASSSISYLTTAPTSANTNGNLILVVLSSAPTTKYSGYIYIITE